jgi:hypothetical protein
MRVSSGRDQRGMVTRQVRRQRIHRHESRQPVKPRPTQDLIRHHRLSKVRSFPSHASVSTKVSVVSIRLCYALRILRIRDLYVFLARPSVEERAYGHLLLIP